MSNDYKNKTKWEGKTNDIFFLLLSTYYGPGTMLKHTYVIHSLFGFLTFEWWLYTYFGILLHPVNRY